MFGFGKKKEPAPPLCPGNPGAGVVAEVELTNGRRTWTESVNLVELLAAALKDHGHTVAKEKGHLVHENGGYVLQPRLASLHPTDDGGARTTTTIQVNHPAVVPAGVFEYQHSAGDGAAASLSRGFDQWVRTDFVALLEALRPEPEKCTAMVMEFPAKDGRPGRVRRAVLGPVMHFMQKPPGKAAAEDEGHPFCPCCLLTRTFEAYRDLFERDEFYAIRLFAARDETGAPQADCRVNGEDWEAGAAALRGYAATWPEAGYEFRKQYVVLQSIEKPPRVNGGGA